MAKINKLFVNYQHFGAIQKGVYLTTFSSETKRSLQQDKQGFYFILNKEKERITDSQDIERIEQFLNIK